MAYVIPLESPAALDATEVGEKAAALARLTQAGLPVPRGFVVPAAVFSEALASVGEAARSAGTPPASRDPRTTLAQSALPHAVAAAISAAYRALGCEAVAVRSSSTAEDLESASFAGQYDSFLNVCGVDAVLEGVRAVWASLYSEHAVAYRDQHGIAPEQATMAVLVQVQLDSDASGVLFTRDLFGDLQAVASTSTSGSARASEWWTGASRQTVS